MLASVRALTISPPASFAGSALDRAGSVDVLHNDTKTPSPCRCFPPRFRRAWHPCRVPGATTRYARAQWARERCRAARDAGSRIAPLHAVHAPCSNRPLLTAPLPDSPTPRTVATQGTIPTEYGLLTKLTAIELSGNSLRSSLPTEFGRLEKMVGPFTLSSNALTSAIPTELGVGLHQLTSLVALNSNLLSSAVPSELGILHKMWQLDLSSNSLSSTIPTELGTAHKWTYGFEFNLNALTGPIPSELGKFTKMSVRFTVERNSLSAAIPTQLGNLRQLDEVLSFAANSLSRTIPTELGRLVNMNNGLSAASNQLSSTVPISNLTRTHSRLPCPPSSETSYGWRTEWGWARTR